MEKRWVFLMIQIGVIVSLILVSGDDSTETLVKHLKGKKKVCLRAVECPQWSEFCCNKTISDFFDSDQFDSLFPKRNSPVAHAVGFWDYRSFITASAMFQPLGFATTGGDQMQAKELAAFFAHVATKTSCGYPMAAGGQWAWGLCYKTELSPSQSYCNSDMSIYPCAPGAQYYGRGALPLYWNYNYGETGAALNVDLLSNPEYLEQNATLAFQAAIWRWMTPMKKRQPSAHQVLIGQWKPTKNDTLSKRVPGFGATMNVLYGDLVCDQGDLESMNKFISHYKYFLDLVKVGQDQAGPDELLSCAEQIAFNPSSSSSSG